MYRTRKIVLLSLIAVSSVLPVFYVRLNEDTLLNVYKLAAKFGSICGTMLIAWQFLLGFRGFAGKMLPDLLWILDVHKKIGRYILFLVALHPIFITLYYIEKNNPNPLLLQGGAQLAGWVAVGMAAFLIFLFIVVVSVFWRDKISYTAWYNTHLTAYLALPLIFVHSFPIGQTLETTGLRTFWQLLLTVVAALYIVRFLKWLGIGTGQYVVSEIEHLGTQMVRITVSPRKNPVVPQTGQFIYFRRGLWSQGRPYTVSEYDPQTGSLSVSVKAMGKSSTGLLSIQPGEQAFIEGPYGVFLKEAIESQRPLVLIAGGIGITPFYRLLDEFAGKGDREMHLFYGSKHVSDIAYRHEIEEVKAQEKPVNVTHVISEEEQFEGEKGFITVDVLKKYLQRTLSDYEYLLCGPPAMIEKIKSQLQAAGIGRSHIHTELFSS
jgi:predicted ferric reductase